MKLFNFTRAAPFCVFLFALSPVAHAKPSPVISGTLSIIPGLGQIANGDTFEGLGWFTTTVGLLLLKDGTAREWGQDLWFYNTYDAYRDAGAKHAAKYSVFENYIANVNPIYAVDPIGTPIVGVAALSNGKTASNKGAPHSLAKRAFYYSAVGLGEEGLFRGFLFPAISDGLGSNIAGAVISSAIFSAAHGEGGSAFVARFVGGMLFCWQVYLHHYDLRPSIFAHSWFDFLLTRKGNVKNEIEWGGILKHEFRF